MARSFQALPPRQAGEGAAALRPVNLAAITKNTQQHQEQVDKVQIKR